MALEAWIMNINQISGAYKAMHWQMPLSSMSRVILSNSQYSSLLAQGQKPAAFMSAHRMKCHSADAQCRAYVAALHLLLDARSATRR